MTRAAACARTGALSVALATAGCISAPSPLAPGLSGSVGVPHAGVLTGGQQLPKKGLGWARLRPGGAHYWGNPRLVAAIQEVAAAVYRDLPGGAPLMVGDLSARDGGKIPGHRSHRTGRDVDLLFYVTTPSGAAVPSPGFVHVGTDGLAKVDGTPDRYARLDVERNWHLVKALITSERARVQWMFASRSVEALLIDYARARGEDPFLIWRAETMLLEPGDSTAHDDHVHLRVACAPEEAIAGCDGGGPEWEWLPSPPAPADLDGPTLLEIAREDPFDLEQLAGAAPRAGDDA